MPKQPPTVPVSIVTEKAKLSTEIRARMSEGGRSFRNAAQALGLAEPTLRTWVHRNRYPLLQGLRLCSYLGLPEAEDELRTRFEFGPWVRGQSRPSMREEMSLREAFSVTDFSRAHNDLPAFWAEVCSLFDHMRDGDLAVLATATVVPEEQGAAPNSVPLRASIARAVSRGARFLYLRPTEQVLHQYRGPWHYDQFPDETKIGVQYQNYLGILTDALARRGARTLVESHVVQIHVTESPFWAPGFVVGMIQSQDGQQNLDRRMWCRLPGGHAGVLYRERNFVFEERFAEFVVHSLRSERKRLEAVGRGKGPRRPTTRLPQPARVKVIEEFQRLLNAEYPWGPTSEILSNASRIKRQDPIQPPQGKLTE